jgi:hypothetical protein
VSLDLQTTGISPHARNMTAGTQSNLDSDNNEMWHVKNISLPLNGTIIITSFNCSCGGGGGGLLVILLKVKIKAVSVLN